MSDTNRMNGFQVPEAVSRFGIADGRPENKRTKTMDSYRRLVSQLTTGIGADGNELSEEDAQSLHGIIQNRADRLTQLAGGKTEIGDRQRKHTIDMLRRSNRNKLERFEQMEKSA